MTNRRSILKSIALAGAAAGSAATLLRDALAAGANPVAQGIQRIQGQVRLNGVPAKAGQLVKPGDLIQTGPAAEAVYVVGQDAFLQRENSRVNFGDTAAAGLLRVISGKLLSAFGRGEKKLVIASATIGIRGTACYIEQPESPTEDAYFCLCYGTADVVPAAAPAKTERIATSHHDHPIYIGVDAAAPTRSAVGPVENHSDAELIMLENLVGRWPPFYGKGGSSY